MRKIEQILSNAWNNNKGISISNSAVINNGDELQLMLFHNVIAKKHLETGKVEYTLAGWNSPTTKSRLKNVIGVNVYSMNFTPYVGNTAISTNEWYTLI
jgi:hypothetical protein